MKIVLAGIQGSGKGTQARILQKKYNFKIFETGAYIRQLSQEDTDIGREIKKRIDAGNLVTIDILEKILHNFLQDQSSDANIIFDGIPRNLEQKNFFDNLVGDFKLVHLKLSIKDAKNRILGRKICLSCQTTYPKEYKHNFCEKCYGNIGLRVDDTDENAIKKRINIFLQETLPVIQKYKKENKVIEIDASKDIDDISLEIEEKLGLQDIK